MIQIHELDRVQPYGIIDQDNSKIQLRIDSHKLIGALVNYKKVDMFATLKINNIAI